MSRPERRRHPRFPFHSQGALCLAGAEYRGTLLDVSLNGALFTADHLRDLAPGSVCQLDVFHAGQPGFCTATARVAYQRESLVGLQFDALSAPVRQLLAQVAAMNLAQEALLTRQLPEMLGPVGGTTADPA